VSASLEIIYLHHSGFAVTTGQHLLIFDYYQDMAKSLSGRIMEGKQVWVFSSHRHADHFNSMIADWQSAVAAYFLSDDILAAGGLPAVKADKIVYMKPYETSKQESLRVTTYGSTDEGVSFLVEINGWRLFHAGDLNWWHWKGDTPENQQLAKDGFMREMELLTGVELDVAFFPVDSRLEEFRAIGAEEFCRRANVRQLVAMHTCGQSWKPSEKFPGNSKNVSVWCPTVSGERLSLSSKVK